MRIACLWIVSIASVWYFLKPWCQTTAHYWRTGMMMEEYQIARRSIGRPARLADHSVWDCCNKRCTKHASLNWKNLKQRLRTQWANWIMSSLRQPFVSGIVNGTRSVMPILYAFSCNISHTLLSTGFKSGEFGGHRLRWDKFIILKQSYLGTDVRNFTGIARVL